MVAICYTGPGTVLHRQKKAQTFINTIKKTGCTIFLLFVALLKTNISEKM